MSSFNKLIVMGNLVADPEIRDIGDGLAKFTLALNDSYKGDEKPTYLDCEFWKPGKVAGYMSKGKPVLLEGRIKQERWQSQDGSNRSKDFEGKFDSQQDKRQTKNQSGFVNVGCNPV